MADAGTSGAILTIDLAAIAANYRLLKTEIGAAELGAVVKADAYGLGMARVAPALAAAGCTTFFVATADEGAVLRETLSDVMPGADIHILDGLLPGTEAQLDAHKLVPVLNTADEVGRWIDHVKAGGGPRADVQVDTGMCRLGLDAAEAEAAAAGGQLEAMELDCVISHLACSEDAASPMNEAQRDAFVAMVARMGGKRASLAASSGVFLGPDYHFDLVRSGVALFGVNPTPGKPNPMAQVIRLQGKILQVRRVDTPQAVGYGATHRVARPSKIATVALGYADGYKWSLGNAGTAFLGGHPAPVVGRVSMDLTTLDVTDVPDNLARPGLLADMIGPDNSVDDVAHAAGTIGYEILTGLGSRLHRVYSE